MHYNWLEELSFDNDLHQVVLQEYVNAVKQSDERVLPASARNFPLIVNYGSIKVPPLDNSTAATSQAMPLLPADFFVPHSDTQTR